MNHTRPIPQTCPNCDTPFPPVKVNFCAQCGQPAHAEVPSVAEFTQELIGHYVALEGKLATTLKLLLLAPGRLTRDYLNGKRQRYIAPLRLYLSVSLVFFLAFKLAGPAKGVIPTTYGAQSTYVAVHYGAYAMFLLIPLFTVFLRVFFSSRRLNYGSHLVFAFHLHTWLFLLFLLFLPVLVLPLGWWLGVVIIILAGVYLQIAIQVAYGGRWWLNIARMLVLLLLYENVISFVAGFISGVLGATKPTN